MPQTVGRFLPNRFLLTKHAKLQVFSKGRFTPLFGTTPPTEEHPRNVAVKRELDPPPIK